jgi:hypothetical protein
MKIPRPGGQGRKRGERKHLKQLIIYTAPAAIKQLSSPFCLRRQRCFIQERRLWIESNGTRGPIPQPRHFALDLPDLLSGEEYLGPA